MARIQKVQPLVHKALLDNPEARSDDFILVLEVYKHFLPNIVTVENAFRHHIDFGLPSFASIMRTRRKLQRMYPELVNEKAAEIRAQEETEYREYALNH